MTQNDTYTNFVSHGLGKKLARTLGLPQPVALRRYSENEPIITGSVVVIGHSAGAQQIADSLLDWGLEVSRHPVPGRKVAGLIVVVDEIESPAEFSAPVLELGSAMRDVEKCGRVITVSRPADTAATPAQAAARAGVNGFVRSLAKELRAGATGNGIRVADGVRLDAPSVLSAIQFLLSGRSAFVDGQFLEVTTDAGRLPKNPARPLNGKVAAVTGAAQGIGAAIARVLARDGAKVIVIDVPAAGESLAKVANDIGGLTLQLDVTAPDAGTQIAEFAEQRLGQLDIVVHNAGITRDKLLANMNPARWEAVLAVNILAQLKMNEALLASGVFSKGHPHIVSVASTSGIAGNRGQTNYATSKAGVIGMVQASAAQLEAKGGSINAVAPGFIETEMTARMPFATREVARRVNSLAQGGRPLDVAEAIAFFASDGSLGINGAVLRVCGQNIVGQ